MMNIYVIMGNTGEYSDHTTWFVAAYTTKEMAELHVQRLEEIMKNTDHLSIIKKNRKIKKAIELDPMCKIDYTGTWYKVKEVKLYSHLDEFLEES